MTHRREYPSQQAIKSVLNYNPETGIFTWLPRENDTQFNGNYAGNVAGTNTSRYVIICINKKHYQAHILAWIYVYGAKPEGDLDHKDRNKKHNWIDNLRPATRSQNMRNYLLCKNNLSGVRGVTWNRQNFRWEAHIKVDKFDYHLGSFKDFDEAVSVRYEAEIKHGFTEMNEESTAQQRMVAIQT